MRSSGLGPGSPRLHARAGGSPIPATECVIKCSGDLPPASPPAEKATAGQDQTGQPLHRMFYFLHSTHMPTVAPAPDSARTLVCVATRRPWRADRLDTGHGRRQERGDRRALEATHAINAHRSDRSGGNVTRPSRQPSHSNADQAEAILSLIHAAQRLGSVAAT